MCVGGGIAIVHVFSLHTPHSSSAAILLTTLLVDTILRVLKEEDNPGYADMLWDKHKQAHMYCLLLWYMKPHQGLR